MARQAGPLFFAGTIDNITFYKMKGVYLARKKSSLDRKRFRADPRFARSRKSAEKFGQASQLASAIYWQLPKAQRGKGVVSRLTGQVGRLLKAGKTSEEILQHFLQPSQPTSTKPTVQAEAKHATAVRLSASTWKITSNGQLVNSTFASTISNKANHRFQSSVVLNSYSEPQLE